MRTQLERWTSGCAAATLVLALLLAPTLACAATESTGSATGATAQGDLIGMLPAQVVSVGYLDYAALRTSELHDLLVGDEEMSVEAFEDLEQFVSETGLDLRTDIHRVAFATSRFAIDGGDEADNAGVMVVSATFDRAGIESALAERFDSETFEGETIWHIHERVIEIEVEDPDAGGEAEDPDTDDEAEEMDTDGYLALLNDDTLVIGSRPMVEAVLGVRSGEASARTNDRLAGLIEDVDPDSQLWFVSAQDQLVADLAPRGGNGPAASLPVDRIRSLILSARFTDGLALQVRGRTPADEDAKLLGDSLNGMLAFGKMMVQSNAPEIFAIIDSGVSAGSSGRDVTIRAELTIAEIEQLRAYLETTFRDSIEGEIEG